VAEVSLKQSAQIAAHKLLEGAVTDCNLTADDAFLNKGVLSTLSKVDNVANFCCDCAKAAHKEMHRSWFSRSAIPKHYKSIYVNGFLKRSTDSIAGYLYEMIPNINQYTLGCSLAGRSFFNVFGLLGRKVLCLYVRNDLSSF
ncbi:unnamed protein product, partial [Cylicocyclus nassatus]